MIGVSIIDCSLIWAVDQSIFPWSMIYSSISVLISWLVTCLFLIMFIEDIKYIPRQFQLWEGWRVQRGWVLDCQIRPERKSVVVPFLLYSSLYSFCICIMTLNKKRKGLRHSNWWRDEAQKLSSKYIINTWIKNKKRTIKETTKRTLSSGFLSFPQHYAGCAAATPHHVAWVVSTLKSTEMI